MQFDSPTQVIINGSGPSGMGIANICLLRVGKLYIYELCRDPWQCRSLYQIKSNIISDTQVQYTWWTHAHCIPTLFCTTLQQETRMYIE